MYKRQILLKVPVGTALTACVAEARPNLADYALIVGGPMMGKTLTDRAAIEAAVVTKTTGSGDSAETVIVAIFVETSNECDIM